MSESLLWPGLFAVLKRVPWGRSSLAQVLLLSPLHGMVWVGNNGSPRQLQFSLLSKIIEMFSNFINLQFFAKVVKNLHVVAETIGRNEEENDEAMRRGGWCMKRSGESAMPPPSNDNTARRFVFSLARQEEVLPTTSTTQDLV